MSLFGDASDVQIAEPIIPACDEWNTMEKLAKEKEVVGIYISGHPLDDYKFEMKYFCNSKLESLRSLEQFVGKNLSYGGIVTNVQHRTAKNGKGWATFLLEGYDESHEFRIFNDEYLKFRHFLVQNSFVFIKVNIKDGWVNRETGKKSDPQVQFLQVQSLQDTLASFAKKLIIHLDIKDLREDLVTKLNNVFNENKGDNASVTFEIMELEKVTKQVTTVSEPVKIEEKLNDVLFDDSIALDDEVVFSEELSEEEDMPITTIETITEVEETVVVNRISMPSRKLKLKISNELLFELEKMQVNFKLN